MKKLLLLLLFASSPAIAQTKRHAPSIQVAIHPNVELLGFAYFLGYEGAQSHTAGYSERTRQRYAYGIDLYHRYQSYENSQHLATVIRFAENIWLDYFINLLVQLENFPNARLHEGINPAYYLRFSQSGDPAEAKHHATQFLDAMNALYREVDFGAYLTRSDRLYASAVTQVRNGLPDSTFLPAVESFYQAHFTSYQLVPSLTLPAGMGFGARYSDKANRHALHVFGTFAPPHWADSADIDMGFNDRKHLLELSTHEFGHSFVNPVVDALPPGLIDSTSHLFAPIRQAMADQGYTSWKACLYEHFVRAGEVCIARNLGRETDAGRLRKHYVHDRHFVYLDVLLEEFEKYNLSKTGTYQQAVTRAMKRLRRHH